jgi:ATP-dependent helicase/nuclease subunit A
VKQFTIFSSSAGSGKTYTLTKEYLKLALRQEDASYFKRILAITFTKDAAREMKDRILLALQAFIDDQFLPEAKQLSYRRLLETVATEINQQQPDSQVSTEILRLRAARMYSRILHEYSDFAVGTIDSFTNRVVSAFTEELGLNFNYEIELDIADFMQHAVDRMLDKVGESSEEKQLSDTLEAYMLEKAEEGGSFRYLPDDLSGFGKNLVNEKVFEVVKTLSELSLTDFETIREQIKTLLAELKASILEQSRTCLAHLTPHQLTAQSFAGGTNGIVGYFEKMLDNLEKHLMWEIPPGFLPHLEKEDWSGSKAKKNEKDIINSFKTDFLAGYEQIEQFRESHYLLQATYKHLHKISVLNEIDKELRRLKAEKNVVHISDFNKTIIDLVLNEPVPFIYERLGEHYNHILIDEFQDTSSLQWNNLLPLVENSLGYGHFNLLVGDAKQAIYGWRGGDMEQIVNLAKNRLEKLVERHLKNDQMGLLEQRYQTLQQHILPRQLKVNYRSRAEIITFNNAFFRHITAVYSQEKPLLADVYDEFFEQEIPETAPSGGHLEIEFLENTQPAIQLSTDNLIAYQPLTAEIHLPAQTVGIHLQSETLAAERIDNQAKSEKTASQWYEENTCRRVLEIVEASQAAGYELRDMAVLVRSNRHGELLAGFLSHHRLPIISSDTLLLKLAESVRFVTAFFAVLHQPAEELLRYECLQLFHLHILNELPTEADTLLLDEAVKDRFLRSFQAYFAAKGFKFSASRLSQAGVYDLSERIIQLFGLMQKPRQAPYLYRFLDVVLQFSIQQSNHLADFMEYWETKKEKLSITTPKDWNAITVTTIHKAKGLEYPVVVLAFADWELAKMKDLFWADLSEVREQHAVFQQINLQAAAITPHKMLHRTALQPQYEAETTKQFIEDLNILYVALTRPTDRLYLLTEKVNFGSSHRTNPTVSRLLYQYLCDAVIWSESKNRYVLHEGEIKLNPAVTVEEEKFVLENMPVADWKKKIWQKRTYHDTVFDTEHFDKNKERYKKITHLLCQIKDHTEVKFGLQKLFLEGKIEKKEMQDLEKEVQRLLAKPEVHLFFAENVKLFAGRQILHQSTATHRHPDRIVLLPGTDGEKLVLLLFRAGNGNEDDQKLLKKYDGLLRQMGYHFIEKIVINLVNGELVYS